MRDSGTRRASSRDRRGQQGFTLLEIIVVTGILGLLLIGILTLFDSSTQVATGQTARTEMQQSLRVVLRDVTHRARMLGRGGFGVASNTRPLPTLGLSLAVRNNVAANQRIEPNDGASPLLVAGTDVLILRGVFDAENLWVTKSQDNVNTNVFTWDLATYPGTVTGTVLIRERTPNDNGDQSVQDIIDLAAAGRPEALLLVSGVSDAVFGVAEITACVDSVDAAGVRQVIVTFQTSGNPATRAGAYAILSAGGDVPGEFPWRRLRDNGVGFVGLLDEYRYYIREANLVEGNATTPIVPRLSRARTYPNAPAGGDIAWDGQASNYRVDIADGVVDFQVALGFDRNASGWVEETIARNDAADEWLLNHPGDDPAGAIWSSAMGDGATDLQNLRITAVARSSSVDRRRRSAPIARIEDHDYDATMNDMDDLLFQRELLQTIIDMRNM